MLRYALATTMLTFLGTVEAFSESVVFGSGTNEFEIEFVKIGNAGNPADETPVRTEPTDSGQIARLGSVAYEFHIAKFEISRETIGIAIAEGVRITLSDMECCGGSFPDVPATGMRWADAGRFVNWLNASQGYHEAYNFDSPNGFDVWEEGEEGFDPNNQFRNRLARFVLPSADEWHKAAYYDPEKNDGVGAFG